MAAKKANVTGIVALIVSLVGIGLTFGKPWTLPSFAALVIGFALGLIALKGTVHEKVSPTIALVVSGIPLAILFVVLVAGISARS